MTDPAARVDAGDGDAAAGAAVDALVVAVLTEEDDSDAAAPSWEAEGITNFAPQCGQIPFLPAK